MILQYMLIGEADFDVTLEIIAKYSKARCELYFVLTSGTGEPIANIILNSLMAQKPSDDMS
jgi:hypothetical protein